LDICACAVPSCYVALFIFERSQAEQKPPKLAVVPQQTSFEFMGLPLKKSLVSFRKEVLSGPELLGVVKTILEGQDQP
jgi:hypothetical protein